MHLKQRHGCFPCADCSNKKDMEKDLPLSMDESSGRSWFSKLRSLQAFSQPLASLEPC